MVAFKKNWILICMSLFLLIITLFSSNTWVEELGSLNGKIGFDKTLILPDTENDERQSSIEVGNMERLRRYQGEMTYVVTNKEAVKFEKKAMEASIIATNAFYPEFKFLYFIEGGFWSRRTDSERGRVAVIDDRVAQKLFGSTHILGMEIELDCQKYKIIGVVRHKASILELIYDDDEGRVYIPASVLMEEEEKFISELQITKNQANYDSAEDILTHIGAVSGTYKIIDYQKKKQQLLQKSRMAVFIMGFFMIARLYRFFTERLRHFIQSIKKGFEEDYGFNVIKKRKKEILIMFASAVIFLIAVGCIWINIRFELYIPDEFIPEKYSDFTGLIRGVLGINKASLNAAYGTFSYIQLLSVNRFLNSILFLLMPAGFALLHSGLSNLTIDEGSVSEIIWFLGIVLSAEVFLCKWLYTTAGLNMYLNTNILAILWGFLFLETINKFKERKKCLENA